MIRNIVAVIILVPLAAAIAVFAVANRAPVLVSFDPLAAQPPMFSATTPLFVVLLVALIAGVVIGGVAAWLRQAKWRGRARALATELKAARAETEALRNAVEAGRAQGAPAIPYRRSSAA
jgi:uncharacterized integral membrane protein